MSEEEIIEENIKRYIKEHSMTIKTYTQEYVDKLQTQLQQKENIIKEVKIWIQSTIDIIKQQPTGDDEWILGKLNSFLGILDKENII